MLGDTSLTNYSVGDVVDAQAANLNFHLFYPMHEIRPGTVSATRLRKEKSVVGKLLGLLQTEYGQQHE